jgi:2-C-methyl-D-erythritol 4-phosphate cytidylyltransferase
VSTGAWLVVVAAGKGVRLGSDQPKALVPLGGRPLLFYSLESAANSEAIGGIVVVADPVPAEKTLTGLSTGAREKLQRVVPGGDTRRQSVVCGLTAVRTLAPGDPVVLVHDAARPFAPPALFDRVAREAADGAVICSLPVVDTVKKIDGDRIIATLPRETLALAQTPQGARLSLLLRAHEQSEDDGAGDDAVLLEALGVPVRVLVGPTTNFKITTPEDLALAGAWVAGGGTPWMPVEEKN